MSYIDRKLSLKDRLFWVSFYLVEGPEDRTQVPYRIAAEECRFSCAIAEVLGVDKLTERLEYVRRFLCDDHDPATHNKEEALMKTCEAIAIAMVLPDIQVVIPVNATSKTLTEEERRIAAEVAKDPTQVMK